MDIFASMRAMDEIQDALEGIAELAKTNVLSSYVNLLKSLDDLRADDSIEDRNIINVVLPDSKKNKTDEILTKFLREMGWE